MSAAVTAPMRVSGWSVYLTIRSDMYQSPRKPTIAAADVCWELVFAEPYHGRKAMISSSVDRKALEHHYDMRCAENMAAGPSFLDIPTLPLTGRMGTIGGLVNASGDGHKCLSGGTNLALSPSQTAIRPAGNPSKRERSTRSDDHGQKAKLSMEGSEVDE
ncbi:hypothetical protein MY10362_002169 [Beauveria mimosiformis]